MRRKWGGDSVGGGRAGKIIGSCLALQIAAVLAAGGLNAAEAQGSRRDVQEKAGYCTDCHGASAQGYHGFLVMPRLAGQTTAYLENQLRAFSERRRERDTFIDMARVHGLSTAMRTALAAHFRDLNPAPLGDAPRRLAAAGKPIYDDGIPEDNVPACAACHGPDARGQDEIPRLAGQLFSYTVKELRNWNQERARGAEKTDTSAVMAPIAHNLSQSQIAAVAAYLSLLK